MTNDRHNFPEVVASAGVGGNYFREVVPIKPREARRSMVDRAGLREFLAPRHHAVIITRRPDGRPQSSPVTCGVDADGRIVISTYPQRAKVVNLRRDPQVSLCVLSDDFGGTWVQVDSTAEVLDLPDALEPLVDYYRAISGEHPDWDEYREATLSHPRPTPSPAVYGTAG
jgi:PPOX class probable F420-dependent enzyme